MRSSTSHQNRTSSFPSLLFPQPLPGERAEQRSRNAFPSPHILPTLWLPFRGERAREGAVQFPFTQRGRGFVWLLFFFFFAVIRCGRGGVVRCIRTYGLTWRYSQATLRNIHRSSFSPFPVSSAGACPWRRVHTGAPTRLRSGCRKSRRRMTKRVGGNGTREPSEEFGYEKELH